MDLQILFEDTDLIAVNKPHGLFVHRSELDVHATEFALQIVRDMIGHRVYPVHRLDRKTSGVLLLAKSKEVQSIMNEMFRNQQVDKTYLAIVRGFTDDTGTIDYPLLNEKGKSQNAITHYTTITRGEIDISSGKFPTSRYSLLRVNPETGRMHQIRRHLSHIFHPIIGDRPHGCNKQNKFFLDQFDMKTMMLHASSVQFLHPNRITEIKISAPYHSEFDRMVKALRLNT